MKEKILKILLMIFALLAAIYPVFYGIYEIKMFLIIVLLVIGLMCATKYIGKYKYGYLITILLIGIITRVGIVLLCNSNIIQVSDFSGALNNSFSLSFSGDYYRVFSHWVLYPTIIHRIYYLFGSYQIVALLVNALINIASAVMIYLTGNLIFNNKKYSFLSSLIYLFWPANILYTVIFTQEHLNALLIICIVYLFLRVNDLKVLEKRTIKYIYSFLIGSLLAVTCFLKNFSPVFIMSFIIVFILGLLKNKFDKVIFTKKSVCLVIIMISFISVKQLIFSEIDKLVGEPVARNITPCYLNVGLRDEGDYKVENYMYYFNLVKDYNYDFDKVNHIALNDLLKYMKGKGKKYYFNLLNNKAKIIINDDEAKIFWFDQSFNGNKTSSLYDLNNIKITNNMYYGLIMLLVGISLIETLKSYNLKTFFLQLLYFGACLILLLVEAQNRYSYSMQVLLCILSVCGIKIVVEYVEKKRSTRNEKISAIN